MLKTRKFLAACVSSALLISYSATAASADLSAITTGEEDETANLIAEVVPDKQRITKSVKRGTEYIASSAESVTSITTAGAGSVSIASNENPTLLGKPAIEVALPAEVDVESSSVASDGTVVLFGKETDVAVQPLADGRVRIQTVLNDASSPLTYTYDFGHGTFPAINPDGTVTIWAGSEADRVEIAEVEKPWAFDADGEVVDTYYSVENTSLVQHIQPNEASAFPIVADPTFGHTWGVPTTYLNWSETKSARDVSYLGWLCGLIPFPGNLLCAGNVATISKNARDAVKANKCLKILIGPGAVAPVQYSCKK